MIHRSATEHAIAPTDDVGLARRIGERDERAFEAVMRAHNRLLYRIARSILKDDVEAEDAVQEAYLSAYRGIGGFRGGARLATWLARITINEAYARLRKRNRAGVVVPFASPDAGADRGDGTKAEETMADDSVESPENFAMRAELRQLLETRIDALPEPFRTVFILRDVEEMSVDETAECLDLPPATVRTRAFRARALLRESLAQDIDVATADAFEFAGDRCDRLVRSVLDRLRFMASDRTPDAGAPS